MAELLLDIPLDGSGADLRIADGDLALDLGLATSALVSVFSDARAIDADDLLDDGASPRGWWGDTPSDALGSRLWQLIERGKLTSGTVLDAQNAVREALSWLLRDGICRSVDVTARRAADDRLVIDVVMERGDAQRWEPLWDGEQSFTAGGATLRFLTR